MSEVYGGSCRHGQIIGGPCHACTREYNKAQRKEWAMIIGGCILAVIIIGGSILGGIAYFGG